MCTHKMAYKESDISSTPWSTILSFQMGKHVYHQILQHHLYEKDVKWITNNDTHGYTWHMISTWWHLGICSGGSDRCCQRCGWRGWRGWNRWNRWNRGTCTWTLRLRHSKLQAAWNLLCFKGFACFTLQLGQSQHDVHSPYLSVLEDQKHLNRTSSWRHRHLSIAKIGYFAFWDSNHASATTKEPETTSVRFDRNSTKRGLHWFATPSWTIRPNFPIRKNQVGASQALPKKTLNIGFLNWMLWRKHCHKLPEFLYSSRVPKLGKILEATPQLQLGVGARTVGRSPAEWPWQKESYGKITQSHGGSEI